MVRRILLAGVVLLCAQGVWALDLECSMSTFYSLDEALPRSLDPSLREWLVTCYQRTQIEVIKAIDTASRRRRGRNRVKRRSSTLA